MSESVCSMCVCLHQHSILAFIMLKIILLPKTSEPFEPWKTSPPLLFPSKQQWPGLTKHRILYGLKNNLWAKEYFFKILKIPCKFSAVNLRIMCIFLSYDRYMFW